MKTNRLMRYVYLLLILVMSLTLIACESGSDAGDTKSYGDGKSSNALLTNLVLSDGELNYTFSPYDWDYTATVAYEVESISITPVMDHINASATIENVPIESASSSEPIPLEIGSNTIKIMVTAWDGTSNEYKITVIREMSTNGNLFSLSISDNDATGDAVIPFTENFHTDLKTYSSVVSGVSDISITAVPVEDGASVEIVSTGGENPESIDITNNKNSIFVVVTAPDGASVTYYAINVTLLTAEPSVEVSTIYIAKTELDPVFDSDDPKDTYSSSISVGKLPTLLTVITKSSVAEVEVNVGSTSIAKMSDGEPGVNQFSLTADDLPIGSHALTITVKASSAPAAEEKEITIDLDVRAGNNDADLSNIQLTWGDSNSQRVLYPGTFNSHNSNSFGFNSDITEYVAVMYASNVVKITATASDSNLASIKINGDGEQESGTLTWAVNLNKGYVTDVIIDVTAEDGLTTRQYLVRVKLLNEYEFYWGIYSPLNTNSFSKWEDKFGSPGLKEVDIFGATSGKLVWAVSSKPFGSPPHSEMTWTEYSDGNVDTAEYAIRTPYNDNHNTNNLLQGIVFDGYVHGYVESLSVKDGIQTGGFTMTSPWGDYIGHIAVNYVVVDAKKIIDPDSYVLFDYMDVEDIRIQYLDNIGPYPFDSEYDWEVPWTPPE